MDYFLKNLLYKNKNRYTKGYKGTTYKYQDKFYEK